MPRDPVTRALRPLTDAEALDRHIQLVQYDGLGLQLNREQDRLVFHYTSVVGLRGILESRSLWASDHRFLNDVSELVFGLQILEMVLASAHGGLTVEVPPDLRADALMGLAMLLEGRLDGYVLSTSFCRRGNLLSQWRAYGGRDGVALAFDRAFLEGRRGPRASRPETSTTTSRRVVGTARRWQNGFRRGSACCAPRSMRWRAPSVTS